MSVLLHLYFNFSCICRILFFGGFFASPWRRCRWRSSLAKTCFSRNYKNFKKKNPILIDCPLTRLFVCRCMFLSFFGRKFIVVLLFWTFFYRTLKCPHLNGGVIWIIVQFSPRRGGGGYGIFCGNKRHWKPFFITLACQTPAAWWLIGLSSSVSTGSELWYDIQK